MRAAEWFGAVALLLLSTQVRLGAQEHIPENEKNPLAGNAQAIAAGERLFNGACQGCHGGGGKGTERGPALTTSTYRRGNRDGEVFLNIRNGIRGTQMPGFSGFRTEQVWQVVSYLRSIAGSGVPQEEISGNATAGKTLFFGKAGCANCHAVNSKGGITAPDLSAAGVHPANLLKAKILDPTLRMGGEGRRRRGAGPWQLYQITPKSGQAFRAFKRAEDSFHYQLLDTKGNWVRMAATEVARMEPVAGSFMPSNYATRLSAGELENVVAYLKTLRERNFAETVEAEIPGGLAVERIAKSAAEPQNWLTYWGNYQGHHFSPLQQIHAENVATLQAKWAAQMPGDSILESTPLVIDGTMYTAGHPGEVFALDAVTGAVLWKYQRKQKVVNPYESNRYNRGVAIAGNRLFTGTLDAALVALDVRTGLPLWEVQVADTMEGYSITAAPLIVKDKVLVGVAGGEYGIRGFVDAYEMQSGKRLWRWYATPGPGEFGNDTWPGETWKTGGGATWLTGSYDPELDLVYWTTGNPGADMDGKTRRGDNLFTCSVVALQPETGKRKWHYQFTPNDSHDWDANQGVILADRMWQGKPRKLLLQANRNGFFYVLDRVTGEFLAGTAFVKQTWNAGFGTDGRPKFLPNSESSPEGTVVYPSLVGGTNWQAPSYDAAKGLVYLSTLQSGERYVQTPSTYEPGKQFWGGRTLPLDEPSKAAIKAIAADTGKTVWEFPVARGSLAAGVLATAGNLVFAATFEGNLIALHSQTGAPLWRFQTGAPIASAAISYAVGGKQYVAVAAGSVLYSFALPK